TIAATTAPSSAGTPRKTRSSTSLRNGHWRARACSKPASAIARTPPVSPPANPPTTPGMTNGGMTLAPSSCRRPSLRGSAPLGWHETPGPVPDEVRSAGLDQRLAREFVMGVVPPVEERLHHALLA